jgi:hypothetical protein
MTAAAKRRDDVEADGVPEFDFGYLSLDEATAEFEMPWIRGTPTMIVRPANEANGAWQSGMLKLSGNRQRAQLASGRVSAEDAKKDREDDRKLYPRYVVVGWRNVVDPRGNPVKFSAEACDRFLRALPNWIFDKLRIFCMRPENFVGDAPVEPDVTELAGNS